MRALNNLLLMLRVLMMVNGSFSFLFFFVGWGWRLTSIFVGYFREQTYDRPTGGIMTVTSELGEPIHKVATRGVKLWGEFDK